MSIERLKNKIDPQMQMSIWPKFFPLMTENDNDNAETRLSMGEIISFLTTVARMGVSAQNDNNAALASQFANPTVVPLGGTVQRVEPAPPQPNRSILNAFSTVNNNVNSLPLLKETYRENCQKLLQYYTLNNTTSVDFTMKDLLTCMIYLSNTPKYADLYSFMESAFGEEYECIPNLTGDEMYNLTNQLRSLISVPTSSVDFNSVRLLRSTVGRIVNYPINKFPRIIVLQNNNLIKGKRCTFEDLLHERSLRLTKLLPQEKITSQDGVKIPFCEDDQFINELLRITHKYSLHRMFYNAANSIFYTTMENFALSNCTFNLKDYNNIYKVMDDLKEMRGADRENKEYTDSLNIFLNSSSPPSPTSSKRKRY